MMVGVHVVAALAGVALGIGAVYVARMVIEGVRRDRRERPEQIAVGRRRERWERAAGKLESEAAAERLEGFAELDQYGREDADAHEDVIELTCAYLRRPFLFPVEDEEEFAIRLVAQSLLTRHLRRSGGPEFREVEELELQDAVLVEPDFADCDLVGADFRDAAIVGGNFRRARFPRFANFDRAHFTGDTDFREASFPHYASFSGALFAGTITFADADFSEVPDFSDARVERPGDADSWPSSWYVQAASPVAQGRLLPRKD
ncbi:hypothetical protein BS329_01200 [Amycolatopsis coloradensis]|uniref:Pentapeptide repeat-containing protein n=1 Tax=Amycolatopsis coloradensis TaxID=76021 RepID=A0A1R0L3Q7_9PSEU|nr:pentapeptide repeat-containing protein [Amycolatopsis coloradensis]OLZ57321.1 hypothetical protein BS329_01200 [Amycolatopsis coloradensis]